MTGSNFCTGNPGLPMLWILTLFSLLALPSLCSIDSNSISLRGPRVNAKNFNFFRGHSPRENGKSLRASRFFPLFTVIQFTNAPCRTSTEEEGGGGVCYLRRQCLNMGGIAQGSCAAGLGVCCQFQANCGGVITQNETRFRNPDFPSKYSPRGGSDVCQVRIRKPSNNVCQLRLNFNRFDIDGPVGQQSATVDAGACKTDALAITSSGAIVPQLCGVLNDQHLYVDFGSSDTITMNLMLSGNVQRDREWDIQVLMIPCNSMSRAPVGCLQYFTGMSGQVESFNFPGGTHLANQDYSICVRMEDGMRAIEWSACAPGSAKFSGPNTLTPTAPSTCPTANFNDYLIIMGGVQFPLPTTGTGSTGESLADRFCDASFNSASNLVRTTVRPFIIHFRSDNKEVATDGRAGFCLKWQMQPY